jgi:uncharacterized protein (TIGR00297 family)
MAVLKFLFDAPATDWLRFLFFLCGIALFIFIAEKTRQRLGWSAEVNRKLVHVLTGILVFFCPFFFISSKPLVWMAALFIAVDLFGVMTGRLKGMHGTARKSYGTVFYPLTFLILVLFCWDGRKTVLVLSMLVLALADAVAALVGENLKKPHEYVLWKDKKSLEGSAAMFLSSFLIVWIFLPHVASLDGNLVGSVEAAWIGLIAAAFATAMEALSVTGSDNLTAPLGAAFALNFMLFSPVTDGLRLTLGVVLGLIVALSSFRFRFLSPSGCVAAFILAAVLFGVGGWSWTVPILVFFISSSLLSKYGKDRKKRFESTFEKTDTRDVGQVLANGGAAGLLALMAHFFPGPCWFPMFLGAAAGVNADTWGTEIGLFSKSNPRSMLGFKPVPRGRSGAVSPLGTAGAAGGSVLIALSGWAVAESGLNMSPAGMYFWAVALAGFAASFADSLLGATIQAQYRCPACAKITEKQSHCGGHATRLVSGMRWMNNDRVNFICSIVGAGIVFLFLRYLNG